MAIGERISFFRNMRGMTQKYLGMQVGFPEKSADVRLAQYETGTRTPKADMTAALADTLDVSPQALAVPDIDSYIGLMHTLFTLEDRYCLLYTSTSMVASNAVRFFFCINREPSAHPSKPVVPEIISKVSPAGCLRVW